MNVHDREGKERRGKVCRHKEIRKGKDVEKGLRRE